MSRITKVSVRVTVINTTANTPAEVVLVVLPYSDYSRTLAEVKSQPNAGIRYLSGSGGIDKVTLRKSASLNAALRMNSSAIRDYQQSASEAASTLALLPDTPVLALYVGGASTEPTLRVFIETFYHVTFFLPEFPSSVAYTENHNRSIDYTGNPQRAHLLNGCTRYAIRQEGTVSTLLPFELNIRDRGLEQTKGEKLFKPSKPPKDMDEESSQDSSDDGSAYHWERYEPQSTEPLTKTALFLEDNNPDRTSEPKESPSEFQQKPVQADHPTVHKRLRESRSLSTEHFTEAVREIYSQIFKEGNKKV